MDLEDIQKLIQLEESDTLEFKKSTSLLSKAGDTLCGFLNGKGGKVLIGVNSNGEIIGQEVSDSTLREIAGMINKFEPPPTINIERLKSGQTKEIIILSAKSRKSDVPYTFEGRPYQRIGSTTSLMPQLAYQKLLLERNHFNHRWENEIAFGYDINDLDTEEILRTLRIGISARRIPESREDNIISILDRFGLRKEEQLLNAAIVLFGKRFLPDFTQCQIRLARFRGIDKMEFIDQTQLEGNAFFLLDEAIMFLKKHIPISGRIIDGSLERKDEPLYPMFALREGLVNAFCHRSYMNPGGAVSVAIYDDRLEIWSDGGLPAGLKIEDLKKDHKSTPRNPLISSVFYQKGLVEKWGSGTQKIVSLCVNAELPEPEFVEQANSFFVRFSSNYYIPPKKISHNLTERQRSILQIIAEPVEGGVSLAYIKALLPSTPHRTLQDDCQHLKRLGLVDVVGYGKGSKWHLKSK